MDINNQSFKNFTPTQAVAPLIQQLLILGENQGKNVKITGETKEKRQENLREILYGSKSHC